MASAKRRSFKKLFPPSRLRKQYFLPRNLTKHRAIFSSHSKHKDWIMSVPPNNLDQLIPWIRIFAIRTQQKFLKMQKEIDDLQAVPEKQEDKK